MLSLLDVFAGAGGLTLGLESAGLTSIGGIEIDDVAAATYEHNFGKGRLAFLGSKEGNVENVPPSILKQRLGKERLFCLAAGLPCQGFSSLGASFVKIARGDMHVFDDKRNALFLYVLEVVRVLRPYVVLLENVPNMLNVGGYNLAEDIAEILDGLGYEVKYSVLNAAAYGVPQLRRRLFILAATDGLKIDFPEGEYDPCLVKGNLSVFTQLKAAVTVGEAFDDLPAAFRFDGIRATRKLAPVLEYKHEPRNWFCRRMRYWNSRFISHAVTEHFAYTVGKRKRYFSMIPEGGDYRHVLLTLREEYRRRMLEWLTHGGEKPREEDYAPPLSNIDRNDRWRRLHRDRQAYTIPTNIRTGRVTVLHYDIQENRPITLRETARLQSFPDAFYFHGGVNQVLRQIGNAVPPLLAEAIGKRIVAAAGGAGDAGGR